jgi:hypothetical protein
MKAKILAVAFLSLGVALWTHQPHAAQDLQPTSEDHLVLEAWLNENGKSVERLVGIGIEQSIAESINSRANDEAPAFVRWQTSRVGANDHSALLFFPCHPAFDFAYLYALVRKDNTWHATDHIQLDCHYDNKVSFETTWIQDPNRDEILLHHACAGHGAGYLEQGFSVVTVSDDKLRVELETEELLRSYPRGGGGRPRDLERNSSFALIPIRNSRSRAIEETRSSVMNGRLTVQRRVFRWNRAKGLYLPSPFTQVVAAPTK